MPLLAEATPENTQPPLDYGKAVLELKAAAEADTAKPNPITSKL
ncbi:hypothetical protein [Nostoc sp. DedSLP04]|nr:hypothetical protein [Nostoc sp. DedSLP04]MDZ8034304.1 hypothetical protein [Nostoc sp. DedSLP04]